MARVSYSKASLNAQRQQLARYRRFLPSLELKRKQLQQETKKAERALRALRVREAEIRSEVATQLPMLANEGVQLESLLTVVAVEVREMNRVGTRVPSLVRAETRVRDYPMLGAPPWYDHAVELLQRAFALRCERLVAEQAATALHAALMRITRRVNLFDKVLIPRTEENIRRIGVYLGDMERAAVARAKIAKSRRTEALP